MGSGDQPGQRKKELCPQGIVGQYPMGSGDFHHPGILLRAGLKSENTQWEVATGAALRGPLFGDLVGKYPMGSGDFILRLVTHNESSFVGKYPMGSGDLLDIILATASF